MRVGDFSKLVNDLTLNTDILVEVSDEEKDIIVKLKLAYNAISSEKEDLLIDGSTVFSILFKIKNLLHPIHPAFQQFKQTFQVLIQVMEILEQGGILNEAFFEEIYEINNDVAKVDAAKFYLLFDQLNILHEERHRKRLHILLTLNDDFKNYFPSLKQFGLINQKILLGLLENYVFCDSRIEALVYLKSENILTPENTEAILEYELNPGDLAYVLKLLHPIELDPAIRIEICKLSYQLTSLPYILNAFSTAEVNLLTNENLLRLRPYFQFLNAQVNIYIARIPPHLFSQVVFDRILEVFANNVPDQQRVNDAIQHICYQVFESQYDREPAANECQIINNSQSTHTSSVHQSVSDSAMRLWKLYEKDVKTYGLDSIIKKIVEYVQNLKANNDKYLAAKRYIAKIGKAELSYTDPTSQVSLREALVLAWIGIHDNLKRVGQLQDALNRFVDALYEMEREYNLDSQGNDLKDKKDKPACLPGQFNKIFEKLTGIHPDVKIIFMTSETASNKFLALSREVIFNYLQKQLQQHPKHFPQLLKELKKQGVSVIYSKISPLISNAMFDEFSLLYKNKNNSEFVSLIDNGEYLNIVDILEKFTDNKEDEEELKGKEKNYKEKNYSDENQSQGLIATSAGDQVVEQKLKILAKVHEANLKSTEKNSIHHRALPNQHGFFKSIIDTMKPEHLLPTLFHAAIAFPGLIPVVVTLITKLTEQKEESLSKQTATMKR